MKYKISPLRFTSKLWHKKSESKGTFHHVYWLHAAFTGRLSQLLDQDTFIHNRHICSAWYGVRHVEMEGQICICEFTWRSQQVQTVRQEKYMHKINYNGLNQCFSSFLHPMNGKYHHYDMKTKQFYSLQRRQDYN